jgi:hypothetical protein
MADVAAPEGGYMSSEDKVFVIIIIASLIATVLMSIFGK